MKINIPVNIFKQLITQIDESLPYEACGLLFGTIHDSFTRFNVQTLQKFENISKYPETSFNIDPESLYQVLCTFEEQNLELVTIYHSHKAAPYPSQSDLNYMEGWRIVWLVFSTINCGSDFPYAAFMLKQNILSSVTVNIVL